MPLFTRETAAIAGRKGSKSRWSKPHPPPVTEPPEPPPAIPAAIPVTLTDDFNGRRLSRIRAQLELVDAAITGEATKPFADGQRLNWLAAAQERLAEQERILAGRPLPGSMRPTSGKRGAPAGWVTMESVAPTVPIEPSPVTSLPDPAAPTSADVRPAGWEYDDPSSVSPDAPSQVQAPSLPAMPSAPIALPSPMP